MWSCGRIFFYSFFSQIFLLTVKPHLVGFLIVCFYFVGVLVIVFVCVCVLVCCCFGFSLITCIWLICLLNFLDFGSPRSLKCLPDIECVCRPLPLTFSLGNIYKD